MSVLSNNVIAGASIADDAAGGAYQIKKSLRFSKIPGTSTGFLTRNFSEGNQRTWTYSVWIKRAEWDASYGQELFGAFENAQNKTYMQIGYLQQLFLYSELADTALGPGEFKGEAIHRDPSAWMHICIVGDSTNSVENERVRFYVNGKRVGLNGHNNWDTNEYAQNTEWTYNKGGVNHRIGRGANENNYFTGHRADEYWIDGLALSPTAFGELDSNTGVWNPKAFALPAPNTNKTWSGMWTGTFDGGAGAVNIFDTSLTTNTVANNGSGNQCVFTPTTPIPFATLRIKGKLDGSYFAVNGVDISSSVPNVSNDGTWTIDLATLEGINSPLTTLTYGKTGTSPRISVIEVDGVILVDDQTDPTTRNNVNNGSTWSSMLTVESGSITDAGKAFNGKTDDYAVTSDNSAIITFTPTGGIAYKHTVRAWLRTGDCQVRINGGSWVASTGNPTAGAWTTVATGSGTLTTLDTEYIPADKSALNAIEIDGHILIDGTYDNSFHLKYDDSTTLSRLGKDSLNGKIADATGALPIYNTDAYGDVKKSGYRTDSLASNLIFAYPGDSAKTDVSNSINSSSYPKGIGAASGNEIISDGDTTEARFYGSACNLDGVYQNTYWGPGTWDDDASGLADFDMGSGDFCIEGWLYVRSVTSAAPVLMHGHITTSNAFDWKITVGTSGEMYMEGYYGGSSTTLNTGNNTCPNTQWIHWAYTRNGNKIRAFINGVEKANATISGSLDHDHDSLKISGFNISNVYRYLDGAVQDIRIYKGAAKYTANFKAPTRNDFAPYNFFVGGDSHRFTLTNVSSNFVPAIEKGMAVDSGGTPSNGTTLKSLLRGDGSTPTTGSRNQFFSWMNSGTDNQQIIEYDPVIPTTSEFSVYAGSYNNSATSWTVTVTYSDDTTASNSGNSASNTWWERSSFSTSGKSVKKVKVIAASYSNFMGVTADNSNNVILASHNPDIDSLVDTPTSYGTESDPTVGGELRGNYCTWNTLNNSNTLSRGNLTTTTTDSNNNQACSGTLGFTSGKWYFEIKVAAKHSNGYPLIGIAESDKGTGNNTGQSNGFSWYSATGTTKGGTSYTAASVGDVIGVAVDADNGRIYYALNNTWQNSGDPTNSAATGAEQTWTAGEKTFVPWISEHNNSKSHANFGQRAFRYTAPTGYKVLCTQNLDDTFSGDELNNPSKYFDVLTYVGTGGNSSTERPFKLGFGPELIWIKDRINTYSHVFTDVINTKAKTLYPNNSNAASNQDGGIKSFDSDGFKIGDSSGFNDVDDKHVAWCWDAGTAAATASTDGSITPSAQWKNTTTGFSISKWTGTGANATIGHGLGAPPEFIIVKLISGADDWAVYHKDLGNTHFILLNSSNAQVDAADYWQDTSPTNTVFSIGTTGRVNTNNSTYTGYAWTPISGYSAFGKYTGTGDADTGQFCYTGFKPKFLLVKRYDNSAGAHWGIVDSERSPFNKANDFLYVDKTDAEADEANYHAFDFLSNGFKPTGSYPTTNTSGGTYIYCAWAENPFKTARAI